MKNSHEETRAAHDAQETSEVHLNALKDKQAQMADQVKQALQDKASAEAGLKTTEKQAEGLRKELHYCEFNLATERQTVKDLREELSKAREATQLIKEAAEAEKQASYALGVQETQSRLTEEFSALARDYCDITWGKALDAARVPADSSLRRPESIYYDSDIQELPGSDSPPPEQTTPVSEVSAANQALHTPVEVPTDSHQDAGQGKKVEAPQGKDNNQEKGKGKALDTAPSQFERVADPQTPKTKT